MKFSEIAKSIPTNVGKEDTFFANIEQRPFRIHGVYMGDDGRYHRMPLDIAEKVSPGVKKLSTNTAGGRIRFKTDSHYIVLKAKLGAYWHMYHFPACGNYGFDVYDGTEYKGTFRPEERPTEFECIITLGRGDHDLTVNMPLYSDVCEVLIGLAKDSYISEADDYKYKKPVVFYGSSITQGGCASRPGTCYQNFLCRKLDFDYINLGFSGSAKAEDAIIEYIADLDMSVFVYDYDHNSPSVEHYAQTHEKMFLAVREKHPDIPIILMSRPSSDIKARIEIIKSTYENALARGDKNVYLVGGAGLNAIGGTVDGCHPNDLGFYKMAEDLLPALKASLEKTQ